MKQYRYSARDSQGKLVTALIPAENLEQARSFLALKNLTIIEVLETQTASNGLLNIELDSYFAKIGLGGVSLRDKVIFSRQLATLINASVPAVKALNILAEQIENKYFSGVIYEIKNKVEEGETLTEAFAAYPKIFDSLFVNLIKAGEAGGVLDSVLNRLAKFIEDRAKLNAKIKAAMTYPTVVTVVATIIFFVMLTVILPQFSKIFEKLGAELPAYTQFLINISNFLLACLKFPMSLVIIVLAVSTVIFSKKVYENPKSRYQIHKYLLKVPVLGGLVQKIAVARFTRTFATLTKSGVPILTSLDIVKDSSGNEVLAKEVDGIIEEIKQGGLISSKLESSEIFPSMVSSMVTIGEETGELDTMLSKIADFYDDEVNTAVDALTSLLEPLMMVVIGAIVGAVIVGMYLPMFGIFDAIK